VTRGPKVAHHFSVTAVVGSDVKFIEGCDTSAQGSEPLFACPTAEGSVVTTSKAGSRNHACEARRYVPRVMDGAEAGR
jgi:hypothetical protein